MKRKHPPRARQHRQRGAFGVLYAVLLPVMLAMIGLAIDLSMVYARNHELQVVADAAALAAARALDGTEAGLVRAGDKAGDVAEDSHWRFLDEEDFNWNPDALRFGTSADGPWLAPAMVSTADLPNISFARVDTAALGAAAGRISIAFLKVVNVAGELNLSRRAVAGRKDSALVPLALCALDNTALTTRTNALAAGVTEAVEFGFRRGVGYNLLNLNPFGNTPKHYMMNPLDFPPAASVPGHLDEDVVRPFMCSGALPAPRIGAGSTVYVRESFPASMIVELNSRFGNYNGGSTCNVYGSPPDGNVIDFRGPYTGFWISGAPTPLRGSALPLYAGGRLATIADSATMPPGTKAEHYGTLWSFARPLKGGTSIPTEFRRADWEKLYPVAAGEAKLVSSYPNADPPAYVHNRSPHRVTPAPLSGAMKRRVLNVPLLRCPVSGSSAEVLGIGKFLMTTPATQSPLAIHAEFGGMTPYGALTASAVLYQ